MLLSFPWLFISFFLYNVIAFASGNPEQPGAVFEQSVASLSLISGAVWVLNLGYLLIAITLLLLFIEVIKATRRAEYTIIDHALSLVLFIVCLVEFIIRKEAATSVFFIILLVTLIDVVAGYSVTIKTVQRDVTIG